MVHGDYEWLNQSVMIFREDSIQGIVNPLWISTLTLRPASRDQERLHDGHRLPGQNCVQGLSYRAWLSRALWPPGAN